jgi:hypothetical protein
MAGACCAIPTGLDYDELADVRVHASLDACLDRA